MEPEITKADVIAARKTISRLSQVEPEIAKAKSCGIECDEEEQRCKHLKAFLIAFNELYGANIPARQG